MWTPAPFRKLTSEKQMRTGWKWMKCGNCDSLEFGLDANVITFLHAHEHCSKVPCPDILELANLYFWTHFRSNLSINMNQIPFLFFQLAESYKNVSQTHQFP